jgi:hypothetical protein
VFARTRNIASRFSFFTNQPYHKESDTDREYYGQAQRAGEGGGERFVEKENWGRV